MSHKLSATTKVVATTDQVYREVGGGAVILNTQSSSYFSLNEVGTRVWALIQEPMTIGNLCKLLVDEYDVEIERLEKDILTLLAKMEAQGLIEVLNEADT